MQIWCSRMLQFLLTVLVTLLMLLNRGFDVRMEGDSTWVWWEFSHHYCGFEGIIDFALQWAWWKRWGKEWERVNKCHQIPKWESPNPQIAKWESPNQQIENWESPNHQIEKWESPNLQIENWESPNHQIAKFTKSAKSLNQPSQKPSGSPNISQMLHELLSWCLWSSLSFSDASQATILVLMKLIKFLRFPTSYQPGTCGVSKVWDTSTSEHPVTCGGLAFPTLVGLIGWKPMYLAATPVDWFNTLSTSPLT